MDMRKIDGGSFWNPAEGLVCSANLVKLMRGWIQSDAARPARGTKAETCKALAELEGGVRAVRPLIKAAMQEWYAAKTDKTRIARPIRLSEIDKLTLAQASRTLLLLAFAREFGFALGGCENGCNDNAVLGKPLAMRRTCMPHTGGESTKRGTAGPAPDSAVKGSGIQTLPT